MARTLPLALQTVAAELIEQAGMAQLRTDFPVAGSFHAVTVKDRRYWYFQEPRQAGGRRSRYVGPDTPELRALIDRHREAKDDFRQRRQMVSALVRAGLPRPDPMTGRVLEALAASGAFRLRAVVVGTVAYQCYPVLIGASLAAANLMTADLDIAQFPSISVAVDDRLDRPIIEVLRSVDPGFQPVAHVSNPVRVTQYAVGTRYRIDILAPNRGPDSDEPLRPPALHADGQPLRFLDYLVYGEIRSIALHAAGILVNVPAPERYALHKLLVGRERAASAESQAKARKDQWQAAELIAVLATQRPYELRDAWAELISRGPGWRRRLREAVDLLSPPTRELLVGCVGLPPPS
ncbi:MAG: GSU2403 family nucleotidyltransferase fold protein [Methylobacterium frigidaeris]